MTCEKLIIDGDLRDAEWEDVSDLINIFNEKIDKMSNNEAYILLRNVLEKMEV